MVWHIKREWERLKNRDFVGKNRFCWVAPAQFIRFQKNFYKAIFEINKPLRLWVLIYTLLKFRSFGSAPFPLSIFFPDFDSFRHKKTLMKGVAIAFHQGEIGIIFLYTFFYIRNISYKRNFIHLYRINYIKILFWFCILYIIISH